MSSFIEPSVEISHRADLSILCNARGIKYAIEIGTDRGAFAANFMSRWKGLELWCIDPYLPYEELNYPRDADKQMAVLALQPYSSQVRILEVASSVAASLIPSWFLIDLVYIDGSHRYEDVQTDIATWWPKLQSHGMLAGHDYDVEHPGVLQAVDEFAEASQAVVRYTTIEPNRSWYVYKTEPKMLIKRFFDHGEIENPRWQAPSIGKASSG